MNFLKPKFWNSKTNIITIFLLPISLLFSFLITVRKYFIKKQKFKIPIICVGNIYLGGTGKTPLSILIAQALKSVERKPVIIKKYYQNHRDEIEMIKNVTNDLIINRNRVKAVLEAQEKKFNLIILDDGFQDYTIKSDLNIICFNSRQLIGNGFILPAGPLRENLSAIKKAKIVIINGDKNKNFEEEILKISKEIKIFYSRYKPEINAGFENKKFFAFAGIGNPDNFFKMLHENNLNIKKKFSFPDHYKFNIKEIQKIREDAIKNNCELITTEKDFFRIKDFNIDKINYIKVELVIKERKKFIEEILSNL